MFNRNLVQTHMNCSKYVALLEISEAGTNQYLCKLSHCNKTQKFLCSDLYHCLILDIFMCVFGYFHIGFRFCFLIKKPILIRI